MTTAPRRRPAETVVTDLGPRTAGGEMVESMVVTPGVGVMRPTLAGTPSRLGPPTLPPETTASPARANVPTRLATPESAASMLERGPRAALPDGARSLPPSAGRPAAPAVAAPASRTIGRLHVVQRGDTVMSLSRRYNVAPDAIARVNALKDRNLIVVGQKLIIPRFDNLVVNGARVMTDVAPLQQRQGLATTPFRHVVEALGGSVTWIGPSKQVQATTADRGQITINIGSNAAQVNDEQVLMDLAAYLEQDRAMVAVKFLSNALDVTVEVDPESGNITVRSNH